MADPRWSRRALASLRDQDDYLRPRNPRAADRVLAEVQSLVALIATFPEMGRRIEDMDLRYHVTRRYRYRVIYGVVGDAVQVVDVLHPRRR